MSFYSLSPADYIGVLLYVVVMASLALITRRTPRWADFALAEKQLPWSLLFVSLVATYVGPGFSIGAVDAAAAGGYYQYILFLPFAVQTLVVGLYFAPRLAALHDCATIGDFMSQRYNRLAQVLTGISSVAICILFTAFLAKVGSESLRAFTGLPIVAGLVVITGISVCHTMYGGLRASVLSDAVQFITFGLMIPLVLILAARRIDLDGALTEGLANTASAWRADTWVHPLGVAISFLLGETLIPPYANLALASRTPAASRRSFIAGSLFCVVWLAVVSSIGVAATRVSAGISTTDGHLFRLAHALLPGGLLGLFLVAILGVVISSQDSVTNAGAVAVTRDLIRPFISLPAERQVFYGRVSTVAIGVAAIAIAGWLPGIIDALLFIYSLWAPTVLVPLLLGLLLKGGPPSAGAASLVSGGVTSVSWRAFMADSGVPPIIPGLLAAVTVFFAFYSQSLKRKKA